MPVVAGLRRFRANSSHSASDPITDARRCFADGLAVQGMVLDRLDGHFHYDWRTGVARQVSSRGSAHGAPSALSAAGEWMKIAPLRILSFDIECAGRKGTVSSAR